MGRVSGTQEPEEGEGSWGGEGQALVLVSADPTEPRAGAGGRARRCIRLTCPFTERRADLRLVTHTPDPKDRIERVRNAQGQVGHGAYAHPVQEASSRESALHGFRAGLSTSVNGRKKKKQ